MMIASCFSSTYKYDQLMRSFVTSSEIVRKPKQIPRKLFDSLNVSGEKFSTAAPMTAPGTSRIPVTTRGMDQVTNSLPFSRRQTQQLEEIFTQRAPLNQKQYFDQKSDQVNASQTLHQVQSPTNFKRHAALKPQKRIKT